MFCVHWGFPSSSVGKESACNAGDLGLIPGLGRSSGEGNGNPLHYSYLENSMDRGPGGLQSMGLQQVRHDWATNFPCLSFCVHCCVNICNWLFLTRVFLSVSLQEKLFHYILKQSKLLALRDISLDWCLSFSLNWHQCVLCASLHNGLWLTRSF